MTALPASTAPVAAGHPLVQGRCPACNGASLFLGSGGYVTCSRLDCPNPSLADDLLHLGRRENALAALARLRDCATRLRSHGHDAMSAQFVLDVIDGREEPPTTANNPPASETVTQATDVAP